MFRLVDADDTDAPAKKQMQAIRAERRYAHADEVVCSAAGMGDAFPAKCASFFEEHLHEDEEIRYVHVVVLDAGALVLFRPLQTPWCWLGWFRLVPSPRCFLFGSNRLTLLYSLSRSPRLAADASLLLFSAAHPRRYILDGSGYFDIRSPTDAWVRIVVTPGDMIVLPAGAYHRFTVDEAASVRAVRLFRDAPAWTPIARGAGLGEGDDLSCRKSYLASLAGGEGATAAS